MLYVFENIYLASPLWFSHALAKLLKAFLSNASLEYATYVDATTIAR
jgi:nucleoside 2-deoxyribosyltransferase